MGEMWVLKVFIMFQLKPFSCISKCSLRLLYTFVFAFVSMSHAATFKIEDQTVPSGATTRAGLLTAPLRDRFGIVQRLEFYNVDDLARIVARSCEILAIPGDEEGAREVARRARGTPRIANRLLRRVRDYAQVKGDGRLTGAVAQSALDMLEVDSLGLDGTDRRLLNMMMHKFDGGPVGLDSLAAALNEDAGTLEEVVEPYLIQQGFIQRTPRGRQVTNHAWRHFGLVKPARDGDLFNE